MNANEVAIRKSEGRGTGRGASETGLVGAIPLLEHLFPDERTRPTLRWLREMQAKRLVPYRKVGRLVYFDVMEVRRALDKQFKVEAIGE